MAVGYLGWDLWKKDLVEDGSQYFLAIRIHLSGKCSYRHTELTLVVIV